MSNQKRWEEGNNDFSNLKFINEKRKQKGFVQKGCFFVAVVIVVLQA